METQRRILKFVVITNWILFAAVTIGGFVWLSQLFALGILAGGLIVTVNFHLLWRTLKKAFKPERLVSHHVVIAKYYMRFFISAFILFVLISQHWVDPLGLFVGLSIVVTSIFLATLCEFKKLIFKEAI
ncbi:ATP synthase subunit I [Candidatus Magnetomorum sp. HK-1]|nr:ATP synthase subunit I [Candidatus Magnetomorum sp. HK-1]